MKQARRPEAPHCKTPEQGPPCPDCGGETFEDQDNDGPRLICFGCVVFTVPASAPAAK